MILGWYWDLAGEEEISSLSQILSVLSKTYINESLIKSEVSCRNIYWYMINSMTEFWNSADLKNAFVNKLRPHYDSKVIDLIVYSIQVVQDNSIEPKLVPRSIVQVLEWLYDGDFTQDLDWRNIEKFLSDLTSKLDDEEWTSLHWRELIEDLILQLNYCQITSKMAVELPQESQIQDSGYLEVIEKYRSIRDLVNQWFLILKQPFNQYAINFENIHFENHMMAIKDLLEILKNFDFVANLKENPNFETNLKFKYYFITQIMLPLCKYLDLHSEYLAFSLLKFTYLGFFSPASVNSNLNMVSHLLDISWVYYKYGQISVTMHNNLIKCHKYIENFMSQNWMEIHTNIQWIILGMESKYPEAISPLTYESIKSEHDFYHSLAQENKLSYSQHLYYVTLKSILSKFYMYVDKHKWTGDMLGSSTAYYARGLNELIYWVGSLEFVIGLNLNWSIKTFENVQKIFSSLKTYILNKSENQLNSLLFKVSNL